MFLIHNVNNDFTFFMKSLLTMSVVNVFYESCLLSHCLRFILDYGGRGEGVLGFATESIHIYWTVTTECSSFFKLYLNLTWSIGQDIREYRFPYKGLPFIRSRDRSITLTHLMARFH